MTVQELIEELKKLDPNLPVRFTEYQECSIEHTLVTFVDIDDKNLSETFVSLS